MVNKTAKNKEAVVENKFIMKKQTMLKEHEASICKHYGIKTKKNKKDGN